MKSGNDSRLSTGRVDNTESCEGRSEPTGCRPHGRPGQTTDGTARTDDGRLGGGIPWGKHAVREGSNGTSAMASVRYIVDDVDAAVRFYGTHLGFRVVMHPASEFAMLSRGDLRLLLSSPRSATGPGGGSAPMPDGTAQAPGGWNRFTLEVDDLASLVDGLREAGVGFRNDIVTGVGGRQILVQDPSGNLVELFEPTLPEAREARARAVNLAEPPAALPGAGEQ